MLSIFLEILLQNSHLQAFALGAAPTRSTSSVPCNSPTTQTLTLQPSAQTPLSQPEFPSLQGQGQIAQAPVYLFVLVRTTLYGNGLFSCQSPLILHAPPWHGSHVGFPHQVHSAIPHNRRSGQTLQSSCLAPFSLSVFLCSPSVPLSSRNFLPVSFCCFRTRHSAAAMLLATVESENERN